MDYSQHNDPAALMCQPNYICTIANIMILQPECVNLTIHGL